MTTLDISNKKCGECGKKAYIQKEFSGKWNHPWQDFPCVFLMEKISLWTCSNCNNVASVKGDAELLDKIIENSIREQASQFIDIIKSKGNIHGEEIAHLIGISPSYLATLHKKNKTPSFNLWNELKAIAIDPKVMIKRLDPSFDLLKEKILLRA